MSRRLVWGDDYAGVGRQMMPALPLPDRGLGTRRHDARGRARLHQADRASRRPSAASNASSTSSSTATAASSATAASMPARITCIEMISLDRIYSIDNDVELAEMARGELGPNAAAMVIDERVLHPLRHLRRLVPDRVPDHGPLPADPGRAARERRSGDCGGRVGVGPRTVLPHPPAPFPRCDRGKGEWFPGVASSPVPAGMGAAGYEGAACPGRPGWEDRGRRGRRVRCRPGLEVPG